MNSAKRFISLASSRDLDEIGPQDLLRQVRAVEALLGAADAIAQEIAEMTSSNHIGDSQSR